VAEVLSANAHELGARLSTLAPEELAREFERLGGLDLRAGKKAGVDLAAVIRAAGGLRALEACLATSDPDLREAALEWSRDLETDEAWLRAFVLPFVQRSFETDPQTLDAALRALERPDCGFAVEPLVAFLRSPRPEGQHGGVSSAASALAAIGDPAVIPALIELVVHDRTGTMAYDVGYFGLARLTGVTWTEECDGAFWLDWWDKNQGRLPPSVRGAAIRR
jgi:hypothetical protein